MESVSIGYLGTHIDMLAQILGRKPRLGTRACSMPEQEHPATYRLRICPARFGSARCMARGGWPRRILEMSSIIMSWIRT